MCMTLSFIYFVFYYINIFIPSIIIIIIPNIINNYHWSPPKLTIFLQCHTQRFIDSKLFLCIKLMYFVFIFILFYQHYLTYYNNGLNYLILFPVVAV